MFGDYPWNRYCRLNVLRNRTYVGGISHGDDHEGLQGDMYQVDIQNMHGRAIPIMMDPHVCWPSAFEARNCPAFPYYAITEGQLAHTLYV